MVLTGAEKSRMIAFLKENTTYTDEQIPRKKDEQLFRMYSRIMEAIPQYIEEIFKATNDPSYIGMRYRREELQKLKYNELAAIRKNLGIRKTRKKVISREAAFEKTVNEGREIIKQMSLSDLVAKVSEDTEEREHEDFLTEEEIQAAYGDERPSDEELREKGIINLDHNEKEYKDLFFKQLAIKNAILRVLREINRKMPIFIPMTMEELKQLDYERLVKVYTDISKIVPEIPKLETIEDESENKLGLN